MLETGCAPGAVYVRGDRAWWSALERKKRAAPVGESWFTPGAAWPIRRALLAQRGGATVREAAALLEHEFADAFVAALMTTPGAEAAYPSCFTGPTLRDGAARDVAKREWRAWIKGGYAVCLRIFSAKHCVMKETLAVAAKRALEAPKRDVAALLAQVEQLSAFMLTFAPTQRAFGTPGLTIDRLLKDDYLGDERSYAFEMLKA